MSNVKPVYIINFQNQKSIEDTKRKIIESEDEKVIFQKSLHMPSAVCDINDFESFFTFRCLQEYKNRRTRTISGSMNIYKTLIQETEKSLFEFDPGFVCVTIPLGSNNERDVDFDFFPSEITVSNFLKNMNSSCVDENWVPNQDQSNFVFYQSHVFISMLKDNAIKYLSEDGSLKKGSYLAAAKQDSKTYVIKPPTIKIFIDPENQDCGKEKSMQRIFYIGSMLKEWMESLSVKNWIQIEKKISEPTFTYQIKSIIDSQARTKGITAEFVTKGFQFITSSMTSGLFIATRQESICQKTVEFLNSIGFSESIENFYGPVTDLTRENLIFQKDPEIELIEEQKHTRVKQSKEKPVSKVFKNKNYTRNMYSKNKRE